MSDSLSPRFDGMTVEVVKGRFSSQFDSDDLKEVRLDDEVFFLVRARVKGAQIAETKTGDLCRTNTFEVADVFRLDNKTAFLLEAGKRPQLALDGTISFDDDEEVA